MLILTVPASSTGNIKIPYTPQFIGVVFGAGAVTRMQVTREGNGVLVNLDENGIKILGQTTNNTAQKSSTMYLLPTADGFINGGTTIDLTTGAGGDVKVYAFSKQKGRALVQNIMDTAVININTPYKQFLKLAGVALDDTDLIQHFYRLNGGSAINVTKSEVIAMAATEFNNANDYAVWLNDDQEFSAVNIQPIANRTMYVQRVIK